LEQEAMRILKNKKYLFGAVAAVTVVMAGMFFQNSSEAVQGGIENELSVLPVSVLTIEELKSYKVAEKFPGKISAYREAEQGFDRPGIVAKIFVDEGSKVEKGQILAQLDTRSIMARFESAKASLEVSKANKHESDARLNMVNNKYNRSKELLAKGHISQQRFDAEEFEMLGAKARSAARKADILRAKAALDGVKADLDLVTLRAPYAGSITRRYVDEGSSLGAARPVLHIIEDQKLVIHVGVPYALMKALKVGEIYNFKGQTRKIPAKLRAMVNLIDGTTRTITAVFDVVDYDLAVPGELAYLILDNNIERAGFWVPTTALAESRRGLWSLYAVVPDGSGSHKTSRREVQLVHTGQDRVFVRGTLKDGDKIIQSGLHRVVPDQRVSIQK
jgi:RND family efflux transporter MFP subunit